MNRRDFKSSFLNSSAQVPQFGGDHFSRAKAPAWHAERKRMKNGAQAAPQYSAQDNARAQALVLATARPMIQQTMAQSISAANDALGQTVTFNLNNVGLQTKLVIEFTAEVDAALGEVLTRTPWGLANIFTNVTLTDLSNVQRINTNGIHLFAVNTLRKRSAYGASFLNDSPVKMGSNYFVNQGPQSIANADGTQLIRMFFELPLAYSDQDLRGAIYSNVTNAQWRVQLTINPNFFAGSGATDTLFNVYQSSAANPLSTIKNVSVQCYQHYLDQLPRGQNGQPIVPLFSLSWNYLLQNAVSTGMVQTADYPVQYANFRTFLSTIAIFDNGGQLNPGTDVNYVAIQVANLTYLEKLDPYAASLRVREMIGNDYPAGTYAFDHRRWPIVTDQFGNTQFVLNANTVNNGANLQMMYEMLALQNQAINAGSLAAG